MSVTVTPARNPSLVPDRHPTGVSVDGLGVDEGGCPPPHLSPTPRVPLFCPVLRVRPPPVRPGPCLLVVSFGVGWGRVGWAGSETLSPHGFRTMGLSPFPVPNRVPFPPRSSRGQERDGVWDGPLPSPSVRPSLPRRRNLGGFRTRSGLDRDQSVLPFLESSVIPSVTTDLNRGGRVYIDQRRAAG